MTNLSLIRIILPSLLIGFLGSTDAFCVNTICDSPQVSTMPQSVNGMIEAVNRAQKLSCQDLQVGQSRVIETTANDSPTGDYNMYKLNRLSNNEYEAVLNIKYSPKNALNKDAVDADFRRRASYCYQRADVGLVGPNGERLHIRLAKPNEPRPLPSEHQILINEGNGNGARGDADDYNDGNFDCPTILHETLHLLGLVDEYPEQAIGLVPDSSDPSGVRWVDHTDKPGFNCRSIGDKDSVMYNMNLAWETSFGPSAGKLFSFVCTCDSPKCKKAFLHPDPKARDCPNGATSLPRQLSLKEEYTAVPGLTILDANHYRVIEDNIYYTGKPLIKAAHFNSIVHPGCPVNYPFYQCAINAYNTTKDRYGQGCLPVPSYCHDGTANWTKGRTGQ